MSDEGGAATHRVTIEINAAPADVWTVGTSPRRWRAPAYLGGAEACIASAAVSLAG